MSALRRQVVKYPADLRSREIIGQLRAELTDMVERLAEMQTHEGPLLESKYQVACGDLELKLRNCHVARLRAQRKIELMRAALAVGRAHVIDHERINETLDKEFESWASSIAELAETIKQSKRFSDMTVTQELMDASRSIKTLYRKLIRELHPDMNGGAETGLYKSFWTLIQSAYKHADLTSLRTYSRIIDSTPELAADIPDLEKDLRQRIEHYTTQIADLDSKWPFCIRNKLKVGRWIEARRGELTKLINSNTKAQAILNTILRELESAVPNTETIH